ncbi:MAG TPA: DUF2846 domain-containing protein [Thermoanaerobaculaceae bacterium]|nr:DUF2846 domain-containing protein [Thermoanaerobaculaceae bacterium]HPS77406.1 DUF2846 domain-containing protein [Thermoanaerobaculaceae bacterium]
MRTRTWGMLAVVLLVAMSFMGCSSTAPQGAPAGPVEATAAPGAPALVAAPADAGDNAYLTVYRKKRIVGLALNTSVYVDGVEVAELDPGTYVKVRVSPGAHKISGDEVDDSVAVETSAGGTYYFRMELRPGMWKGHGEVVAVDAATGAAEFAEYKCKLAKEIKVPAMVVE